MNYFLNLFVIIRKDASKSAFKSCFLGLVFFFLAIRLIDSILVFFGLLPLFSSKKALVLLFLATLAAVIIGVGVSLLQQRHRRLKTTHEEEQLNIIVDKAVAFLHPEDLVFLITQHEAGIRQVSLDCYVPQTVRLLASGLLTSAGMNGPNWSSMIYNINPIVEHIERRNSASKSNTKQKNS